MLELKSNNWRNMKKFLRGFTVLLFVAVFGVGQVSAQSTGLGIAPRKDVTILPGKSFTDKLTVNNLNKTVALNVTLSVIDFKAADQTGTPALQLDENAPRTPWSLKPFITIPTSVQIPPGQSKNIDYTIRIPEGQGAGSYYSAIRYSAQGAGGQNVTVSASAATLVFVTVPGKTTELLNLKQFGAYETKGNEENGTFKSLFITKQPEKLAYVLENVGNVAESPSGSIIIKNIFGKQVKLVEKANLKGNLALIDQTRRFETCISPEKKTVGVGQDAAKRDVCGTTHFLPGMYKAQLSAFYGINGSNTQEINATASFWYLPYWFIAVILVLLALMAFGIYKVRSSLVGATTHRRTNKRR
jgi:hypothetical protein